MTHGFSSRRSASSDSCHGGTLTQRGQPRAPVGLHADFRATLDTPSMKHPWRCRLGHENRSDLPVEAFEVGRRHLVVWCSEPGCPESTTIFVGSTTPSQPPPKRLRPRT